MSAIMKYFYKVFLIVCFRIPHKECTIDINLPEYVYLADHLTADECQRLFASLHFISYDLPEVLENALKTTPKDIPCIKLLLKWNNGQEKWEGKKKSHLEVGHRLRQIGRNDLADWLGKAVFHNLAKDMNDTLVNATYFDNKKEIVLNYDMVTDKEFINESDDWSAIDSVLCVILVGVLGIFLISLCRILVSTYKKSEEPGRDVGELIDLLSASSVESDAEVTTYEYRLENKTNEFADNVSNKQVRS